MAPLVSATRAVLKVLYFDPDGETVYPDGFDAFLDTVDKEDFWDAESVARSVLRAIRDPSKFMLETGSLAFSEAAFECGKPSKEALRHAWQVMIDTALTES